VPVLLVRESVPVPEDLKQLLVALDGSPLAERALEPAVAIARSTGATLHLVRVVTSCVHSLVAIAPEAVYLSQEQVEEIDHYALKYAGRYLADTAKALEEPGLDITYSVRFGIAREALVAAVDDASADMIVATSRGCGGLKRAAQGSVVTELVHHANCPVLVVPPERAAEPELNLVDSSNEDIPTSWQ